jgi:P27 family predicted phage terminase small subunit
VSASRPSHAPAPRHLSPEAAALWHRILRDFSLEAHHLAILSSALEAHDRMRQAQASIADLGVVVSGRYGPRANPAVAIERDSRLAFLRAVRELGLDLEAPATSRPPTRWR